MQAQSLPGGHRWPCRAILVPVSDTAPDIARQILEAFELPTDPAFVRLITTPDLWQQRVQRYREALPARMAEVQDEVNWRCADLLPEGMRFEWLPSEDASGSG